MVFLPIAFSCVFFTEPTTCLSASLSFSPYCLLSTLAAALRAQLQAFLEVTGNVSDGCEAGSAVKGTWLVFVSTMIPQASECWRIVLFGSAGSVLVVQALLMIQDWTCWKSRFLIPLLHCCSTSIPSCSQTISSQNTQPTAEPLLFSQSGQQQCPTRQRHCVLHLLKLNLQSKNNHVLLWPCLPPVNKWLHETISKGVKEKRIRVEQEGTLVQYQKCLLCWHLQQVNQTVGC